MSLVTDADLRASMDGNPNIEAYKEVEVEYEAPFCELSHKAESTKQGYTCGQSL